MWHLYVNQDFGINKHYVFKGDKYDLFALIGCMHSTWEIHIKRISYTWSTELPTQGIDELYLLSDGKGSYVTRCIKGGRS